MLNYFEGLKLTLTSLKISHLEQLNSKISPRYRQVFLASK